ncbi:MAG: hypothetical protein Kow0062_11200 [Acidobacteriota bacterium]
MRWRTARWVLLAVLCTGLVWIGGANWHGAVLLEEQVAMDMKRIARGGGCRTWTYARTPPGGASRSEFLQRCRELKIRELPTVRRTGDTAEAHGPERMIAAEGYPSCHVWMHIYPGGVLARTSVSYYSGNRGGHGVSYLRLYIGWRWVVVSERRFVS